MRRLLVLFVLVAGMVAVGGGTAWACSCVGYPTEAQRYRAMEENATAVYTGTVLGPYANGGYDVRVESNLKASSSGVRHVLTEDNEAACGIQLEPGRVFLVEHDGNTGLCSGTTQDDVDGAVDDYERYNGVQARPAPAGPSPVAAPTDPVRPTLPRTGLPTTPFLVAFAAVAAALGARGVLSPPNCR